MVRTIVYISNALRLIEKEQLDELFYRSVRNNKTKDITGVLLYKEGTFIQILEGQDLALSDMLKVFEQDKRHNNITIVLDKIITKRLFINFTTGLSSLKNAPHLNHIESILKNCQGPSHSHTILVLLGPFLNIKNTSLNIIQS
ncbi:BLUF domain-containing protein [Aequorivita viscosa]|nr:BLUF domain-containing protein [Aequorivita viscosa]